MPTRFGFLVGVIGGSQLTEPSPAESCDSSNGAERSCGASCTVFALCGIVLYGGVGGHWSALMAEAAWYLHWVMLAAGATLMGGAVSLVGSLIFGRNPIRWGMAFPVVIFWGGVSFALIGGKPGALDLLAGSPLLCGLAICGGLTMAYAVDRFTTRPIAA